MLTAGQPVHEVARYLGHSPQVLLTSYSHVLRGRQEHVASTMPALLDPRQNSEAEAKSPVREANDQIGPRLAPKQHRAGAPSPQAARFVGRPTGLEPVTPGATVQPDTEE